MSCVSGFVHQSHFEIDSSYATDLCSAPRFSAAGEVRESLRDFLDCKRMEARGKGSADEGRDINGSCDAQLHRLRTDIQKLQTERLSFSQSDLKMLTSLDSL